MGNKLYVGNLPFQASEEELTEFFAKFGHVADVKVIVDRDTGRSRGYGFVTFADAAHAEAALAVNGQDFQGRELKANFAREREDRRRGNKERY